MAVLRGLVPRLSEWGERVFHFIDAGILKKIPRDELFKSIRPLEPDYLKSIFEHDYRQIALMREGWDKIKYLRKDAPIPEHWHLGVTWRTREPYIYHLRLRWINVDTGETGESFMTVESSRPLSRNELSKKAHDIWDMAQKKAPEKYKRKPVTDIYGLADVRVERALTWA